jgi:type VI secretion system secreted protein Hcp
MAVSMVMKVEGADGESKFKTSYVDVDSFSWGATQAQSMATGGGGGAARVDYHDLHVSCKIDKATPGILKHCSNGKHLGKVELECYKASGDPKGMMYCKITLQDVIVTSVQFAGADGSGPVAITYGFQGAKVKTDYTVQTDQGGAGASNSMGWDVKLNQEM